MSVPNIKQQRPTKQFLEESFIKLRAFMVVKKLSASDTHHTDDLQANCMTVKTDLQLSF